MQQRNRRSFLANGLNAALATSASPLMPPVSHATLAEKNDCLMLGFSTYGMKAMKTEDAVREIATIGFDSIEITVWPDWDAAPANMPAPRRKALASQIHDSGLVLTSLMEHVSPVSAKADQSANLSRLKGVFELASHLRPAGPALVQTVLGSGDWKQKRALLVDRVGTWTELAAKFDTVLAIKPHRGGVMSRPVEAVWLIEQLDKPVNLKIVYDYSHYAFRDMTLPDTVQTALPYIGHVAVKDPLQDGDRIIFKLPGEAGTIPYPTLLKQLFAGGYRGDISCEVSGMVWKKSDYDPVAAARQCYAMIAEAFAKADLPRP